jgi:apolipoprotein N-acyltransferase
VLKTLLAEHRAARFAITVATGAAGVLCFAPFGLFWLAPLIWLGLFQLLRSAGTTRQAALTGLAFGLGFFLSGVSWVYVSLSVFGGMPWWLAGIAAFLFCSVMALFRCWLAAFKRWQPEHSTGPAFRGMACRCW